MDWEDDPKYIQSGKACKNNEQERKKFVFPKLHRYYIEIFKRNLVFAINSYFLIPLSLWPNLLDLKIFQNKNSILSNNLSLKYQRFTTPGWKDIGIRKLSFVVGDYRC